MPELPMDDRDSVVGWDEDEIIEREDMFWGRSIADTNWQEAALEIIAAQNRQLESQMMARASFGNVTFRGTGEAIFSPESLEEATIQSPVATSDGNALFTQRHPNRADDLPRPQPRVARKYHPGRDERLAKHAPKSDGDRRTENVPLSALSI